ncbi:MAG TPA: mechanosensitive ion channel domain-containing protein [Candidatus Elarobacter sp.]|jgi:small-conductance mechanosensitive channel
MDHTVWLSKNQLAALTELIWVLIAIAVGLVLHRASCWALSRWAERSHSWFAASVVRRTQRPAAYIFPLVAILVTMQFLDLPAGWVRTATHVSGLFAIAAVGWTLIALIRMWGDIVVARHRVDVADNLLARQLGTRVDILSRVGVTVVVIVTAGMILMTFPPIRALGTTLLASAGLAGIVVGLAARPLFENLVAGIQLALTQPIRIDDVVIVEKQFGRVEEIHSTYVVVRLWDLRRMVVPLTYFINTPFENWTRRTANLVGDVVFFADYGVDVDAIRAALPKILERTPLWDRQVQTVQVVDTTEKSVKIRALVSAPDSATLFDLRCFVREALVAYLRDEQPQALPVDRVRQRDEPNDASPPGTANGNGARLQTANPANVPSGRDG